MLDVYFSEKYHHHWADIVKLAQQDDAGCRKKLRAYALEACRLSTQSYGLFRRVAEPTVVEEAGKKYNLKTNDQVFVNLVLYPYFVAYVGWSKRRSRCVSGSVGDQTRSSREFVHQLRMGSSSLYWSGD